MGGKKTYGDDGVAIPRLGLAKPVTPPVDVKFVARLVVALALGIVIVLYLYFQGRGPPPVVDTTTVSLLVLLIVVALIPFATKIVLPGGAEVDFSVSQVDEAKKAMPSSLPDRKDFRGATAVAPHLRHLPQAKHATIGWMIIEVKQRMADPRGLEPDQLRAADVFVTVGGKAVHARRIDPEAARELAMLGYRVLVWIQAAEDYQNSSISNKLHLD